MAGLGVVFIGLVSLSVQGVDTILRKVNPALFKAFGVYLVLVIANCIAIAVPLILADNEYTAFESLALAFGAGLGFLIALFLMSSAREKLELANVPPTFKGLPIAFVVASDPAPDEAAIKAHIDTQLAHYKQIHQIHFVDEIPKSASGKILRRLLRDQMKK